MSFETRKPVLFTLTLYVPGTTFAKKYLPVSFVVADRGILVEVSVNVTVAPTTAPPDGSVTVPATVPLFTALLNKDEGVTANKQNNAARSKATRLVDIQLPPGWAPESPRLLTLLNSRTTTNGGEPWQYTWQPHSNRVKRPMQANHHRRAKK